MARVRYVSKNTLHNTDVIGSIQLFAGEEDLESCEIREVHLHASFSFFLMRSVQVNLCQKLLFLHQLIHNMTTYCSLNCKFNT